jgi:sodium-dependent dicarboxylate transporter 2/3/5
LAFSVLSLKSIALKPARILFALGLTSLFLSMWISNTATTAMMYPIALGILGAMHSDSSGREESSLGLVLLLGLAYSASIGGIGTPIGSPPNLIAIGMLEKLVNYRINFFQWMLLGFLVLIPMYFVLFFLMKSRVKNGAEKERVPVLEALGPDLAQKGLNRAQKNVLAAFSITVFLWTFPGIVAIVGGRNAPLYLWLHERFPESVAAIIGAGLLFFLPVKLAEGRFTLSIKEAMNFNRFSL